MRHLILGNGAAGMTAAGKLRELAVRDEIVMASWEDSPAYAKFLLPDYIGGKITRDRLFIRDEKYYETNRIQLMKGRRAAFLDVEKQQVRFEDGGVEAYDRLLIATGGIPFVPPIQGIKESGYFVINSVQDAEEIKKSAKPGDGAVVIGGGLTGIEMAFALRRLGMEVTILERESRMLPVQLDDAGSQALIHLLSMEGIQVLTGAVTQQVSQVGSKKSLLLADGSLECDMLVLSIGTRSNLELVCNTSIRCNRGILVDQNMQTSVENVFAAGDVAELNGGAAAGYVSCYIWPNAIAQGKNAAMSMAGSPEPFEFQAGNNATQLRDIPFYSMGMVNPKAGECEILTHQDAGKGVYKKLILKDNIIRGMTFIGDVGNARQVTDLIRKETDVSGVKNDLLEGAVPV